MSNCNGVYGVVGGQAGGNGVQGAGVLRYDPNAGQLQGAVASGWGNDDRTIWRRINDEIDRCSARIKELEELKGKLSGGELSRYKLNELRSLLNSLDR